MTARPLANPQRTTLAHLQDSTALAPAAEPTPAGQPLVARIANPQRTVLAEGERQLQPV